MPPKIQRLKSEAKQACIFRGHVMTKFHDYDLNTKAYATCKRCGRRVDVTLNPAPNDVEVGGEAVALGCTENNPDFALLYDIQDFISQQPEVGSNYLIFDSAKTIGSIRFVGPGGRFYTLTLIKEGYHA